MVVCEMRELKGKAKDLKEKDEYTSVVPKGMHTKGLTKEALKAYSKKIVYEAKISEEKSLQEQLKTKDLYREYVPVSILSVYFKLIEKIAQDTYIKIHSIMPECTAYAKQNDAQGLEKLIQNEIKNVFEVNIRETLKEINKDGYKIKV